MNSGYVGQSMSKRAENAYADGLLSKAKIKKDNLVQVGIDLPVGFIKWLMPSIITPTEWHHTGKHFNETDFYDLEDVKEQLEELDVPSLQENYNEERESIKQEKGYYALIEYGEWSGSRKHPKLTHYEDFAYVKGNWAYISDDKKKSIVGNHYEELKTYKIKHKRMDVETRNNIFKKLKIK